LCAPPYHTEEFLTHQGVTIFHAYKDELSDVPLDYWYSTCASAPPDSCYEFDVRDLPAYQGKRDRLDGREHRRVIRAAIAAGLLGPETPLAPVEDQSNCLPLGREF